MSLQRFIYLRKGVSLVQTLRLKETRLEELNVITKEVNDPDVCVLKEKSRIDPSSLSSLEVPF